MGGGWGWVGCVFSARGHFGRHQHHGLPRGPRVQSTLVQVNPTPTTFLNPICPISVNLGRDGPVLPVSFTDFGSRLSWRDGEECIYPLGFRAYKGLGFKFSGWNTLPYMGSIGTTIISFIFLGVLKKK